MADWIEFGRGPLFRLSFALMLLGTLRVVILAIARNGAPEEQTPSPPLHPPLARPAAPFWRPVRHVLRTAFHLGLLLVPLFLGAHVLLWRNVVGFAWPAIPQSLADWLTLTTIAAGLVLFIGGLFDRYLCAGRRNSPAWLLLLLVPFATGYLCAHAGISAETYQWLMLLHLYSGNAILLLIPFTNVAGCVLSPLAGNRNRSPWKPLGELLGIRLTRIGSPVAEPRKES